MKTITRALTIVAGMFLLSTQLIAQSNTFPTTGNAGIGTGSTLPSAPLQIVNTSTSILDILHISSSDADMIFGRHRLKLAAKSTFGNVPYIEWITPAGKRQGYMGWVKENLNLSLENGYNFSINGGKVGIGLNPTDIPRKKLHLNLGASRDGIRIGSDGDAYAYSDIEFSVTTSAERVKAVDWTISHRKDGYFSNAVKDEGTSLEFYGMNRRASDTDPTIYYAPLAFKPNGDVVLVSPKSATPANVGIGRTDPNYKLDVNGSINVKPDNGYADIRVEGTNGTRLAVGVTTNTTEGFIASTGKITFLTAGSVNRKMVITEDGNVAIGTGSTSDGSKTYKLSVEGSIRAKEVKVYTNWADFVFEPSYRLRPLAEVETYIKTNGHLPEIPSAKEVEVEGVDIGETQAKLLQKIEELTLYLIEQNKQIEALKKEISELKK
jgi:hypothetical protein